MKMQNVQQPGNMDNKMIGAIVTAVLSVGGLTTAGIVIDRPAMISELENVAAQSKENQISILLFKRQDIQKSIYQVKDRMEEKGRSFDRKQRLRQLYEDLNRINELIAKAERTE